MFLGRIPYRRRRLRDAARLLPLFGLFFLLLPLIWAPPGSDGRRFSGDLVYLFGLWVGMIALAAAIAPGLSRRDGEPDEDED